MGHSIRRILCAVTVSIFLLQTAACGVILHPERKGQTGGRIDPAIAVLDGIGLLFFLVPGVIAFAVDFATGTIYLPGTYSATGDASGLERVRLDTLEPRERALVRAAVEAVAQGDGEPGGTIDVAGHEATVIPLPRTARSGERDRPVRLTYSPQSSP